MTFREQLLKRCPRCEEFRSVEDFAWRRKSRGQRQPYCRPCQAAYNRDHYLANKAVYIQRATERTKRITAQRTAYLFEYFEAHPCVDCGEGDPLVLEFDHVEGEKSFNIAQAIRDRPWNVVLKEIEKCDVVCANCHRRRTSQRGGFIRTLLAAAPKA